jgi:hypothetical protein
MADEKRELLRHTVATLAYRGGKAIRGAPAEFSDFTIDESPRTAGRVLAHIGDLMDWAVSMAEGKQSWKDSDPLPWEQEAQRFHSSVQALDDYLASDRALAVSAEMLFQGPIADALTHVGQIAMMRRIAGVPIKGENYAHAEIVSGRVGSQQAAPRKEF